MYLVINSMLWNMILHVRRVQIGACCRGIVKSRLSIFKNEILVLLQRSLNLYWVFASFVILIIKCLRYNYIFTYIGCPKLNKPLFYVVFIFHNRASVMHIFSFPLYPLAIYLLINFKHFAFLFYLPSSGPSSPWSSSYILDSQSSLAFLSSMKLH